MGVKEGPSDVGHCSRNTGQARTRCTKSSKRLVPRSGVKLHGGEQFCWGSNRKAAHVPKTRRITEMRLNKLAGARSRRILKALVTSADFIPNARGAVRGVG